MIELDIEEARYFIQMSKVSGGSISWREEQSLIQICLQKLITYSELDSCIERGSRTIIEVKKLPNNYFKINKFLLVETAEINNSKIKI